MLSKRICVPKKSAGLILRSFPCLRLHPHRPEGPQHVAELQVQFPGETGDQPNRSQQSSHGSLFLGVVPQIDAPEEEIRNALRLPSSRCQFVRIMGQPIVQKQQHLDFLGASHQRVERGLQRRHDL
jgi:hypothetical protein